MILLYTQAVEPILSPLPRSPDSSKSSCFASNVYRSTRKVPPHKPLPLLQMMQLLVKRFSTPSGNLTGVKSDMMLPIDKKNSSAYN
jgi:hypothetical protein